MEQVHEVLPSMTLPSGYCGWGTVAASSVTAMHMRCALSDDKVLAISLSQSACPPYIPLPMAHGTLR